MSNKNPLVSLANVILASGFHLGKKIGLYRSLSKQRRALGKLNAQQLEDVGITAEQAETETALPFWSTPTHQHPSKPESVPDKKPLLRLMQRRSY